MQTLDYRYKTVESWGDLHTLIKYCKQTGYCSSDYETSGTHAMYPSGYPTLIGISFQQGGAWILPLAHKDSKFLTNKEWLKMLKLFGREVIENPDIIKIGQNIKFEINWWRRYGIEMRGRVFDTMLAKYLLDEERPHGLKEMVERFLPEYAGYDLPGQPGPKAARDQIIQFWSNVDIDVLSKYCAYDADLTFRLWVFFEKRLIDNKFYTLYRNMLIMASHVLGRAEWEGMDIDRDYLHGLLGSYKKKIDDLEIEVRSIPIILNYEKTRLKNIRKNLILETQAEIEDLRKSGGSNRMIKTREQKVSNYIAGQFTTKNEKKLIAELNFNSPAQMIELFFISDHGFKFPIIKYTEDKKTKKETDRPSTDEEVLLELQHLDTTGFVSKLLEFRGLTKLYSTYIKGMWDKLYSTNKIHGSFLLHGTVTGRLSSRNPNLQNIPRDTTASDIKKMFICPPGKLMFQLDYSQAELRVLAAAAKEETMIHWFKTGRDIHLASACDKNSWNYDERKAIWDNEDHPLFKETKVERKKAKTINFGIVYGQTAKKLSLTLSTDDHKVSKEEAQEFLDDFNRRFPKVAGFIKKQKKFAEKNGYVKNLFGRKRRLPNIYSDNWGKKAEAQRQSINAPIQGAASDFALFSSIVIRDYILQGKLPDSLVQVGTVHDSLIFFIDPATVHDIIPILYNICKNPETKEWFNFEVKGIEMKVDFELGTNWGELHNYDPSKDYTELVT